MYIRQNVTLGNRLHQQPDEGIKEAVKTVDEMRHKYTLLQSAQEDDDRQQQHWEKHG